VTLIIVQAVQRARIYKLLAYWRVQDGYNETMEFLFYFIFCCGRFPFAGGGLLRGEVNAGFMELWNKFLAYMAC
jgi:uncharacterized membrane protein